MSSRQRKTPEEIAEAFRAWEEEREQLDGLREDLGLTIKNVGPRGIATPKRVATVEAMEELAEAERLVEEREHLYRETIGSCRQG